MRAVLAVLVAALCFATTGTAQDLAAVAGSSASVGLARIVLGGAVLAACSWWVVRRAAPTVTPRDRAGLLARWPRAAVVVIGAGGVLAYQPTFFQGTASNGVAVGTVVALGSAPVVTGVLDAVVNRRRPDRVWAVATALALLGVVLVSGVLATGDAAGPSILWSVGAGASYAVYTLAAKELLDSGWPPQRAMGALFGLAAAVAAPLLVLTAPTWILTTSGILLVLWLGLVTTAVAYLLFGWGLARLPAPTVATLTLAEPLGATVLGLLLLGESLGASGTSGLVVLAVGLTVLSVGTRAAAPRGRVTGAA